MTLLLWLSILSLITHSTPRSFFPTHPYALFADADSEYITYDGTISAQVWYPPACCTVLDANAEKQVIGCNGTAIPKGPLAKTQLLIGVNPNWDTNNWFFELYRSATESSGFFTNDSIWQLDFASAVDSCWVDGEPCGLFNFNPTFVGETVLDLSEADAKEKAVDGSPGYLVTGGSSSFSGKSSNSYLPSVNVDAFCYFTDSTGNYEGTFSWTNFTWLPGTNFSYSLSFSNVSAEMTIMTYFNGSQMQLEFSGSRGNSNSSETIELITSNLTQPQFQNIDGQPINFSTSSSSTITSTIPISSETPVSSTSLTITRPTLTRTSSSTATPNAAAIRSRWPQGKAYSYISGSTLISLFIPLLG